MAAAEVGVGHAKRATRVIRTLERRLARAAAAVGYVSDAFAEHLPKSDTSIRLHNWSQLEPPTLTAEETRSRRGWGDKVVLVHAGNMGDKQGLDVVVEAAELRPDAQFIFLGDGHQRRSLERQARALGVSNVEFLGRVSDREHANVVCAADALLLVQKDTVRQMSLPSKLQTYLDARRPILACVAQDSETAASLRGTPHACVVTPGDRYALARAIGALPAVPLRDIGTGAVLKAEALAGYDQLLEIACGQSRSTAATGQVA
jgi:glycosyltransferase involved in cell wall biosynthesis